VPLVVKGRVAGRIMDIADEPMQLAVAPHVLRVRENVEIDLTALPDMPDVSFSPRRTLYTADRSRERAHRRQRSSPEPMTPSVMSSAAP
jgi:hypothetical protein